MLEHSLINEKQSYRNCKIYTPIDFKEINNIEKKITEEN